MEEEGENTPPFWVQSSTHRRRIPLPSPSLFINSGLLLFTLCITTLALFILFISLSPQIFFKPSFVKKSWDSLNITLVLLALLFWFLSRNVNHDNKSNGSTPRGWYEGTGTVGLRRSYSSYPDLRESPDGRSGDTWRFYDDMSLDARVGPVRSFGNTGTVRKTGEGVACGLGEEIKSDGLTPRGWYGGSDRTGTVGLRRGYGSYPDLRENPDDRAGDRWRFYDDMGVSRVSPVQSFKDTGTVRKTGEGVGCGLGEANTSDGLTPRGWYWGSDRTGTVDLRRSYGSYPDLREIPPAEDTGDRCRFYDDMSLDVPVNKASRVSPVQTIPSTGTVPKVAGSVASFDETGTTGIGTSNGSLVQKESVVKETNKIVHGQPVQTIFAKPINDDRSENVDLESNPTAEISLPEERVIKQVPAVSRRTRRTAETMPTKGKSSEDLNGWDQPEQFTHRKTKSTDEIDSKLIITPTTSERKTKTKHFLDSFRKKKKKQRQKSTDNFESLLITRPQTSHLRKITVPSPPPPPARRPPAVRPTKPTAEIGRFVESPLHPIPPPPPLPPFKMPKWKFVVKGDYVKIGSMSLLPDSPTSSESGETPTSGDGGDVAAFCPSPDVNSKADMFITNFRAGLKLQKMNSMKQKSNLGPK